MRTHFMSKESRGPGGFYTDVLGGEVVMEGEPSKSRVADIEAIYADGSSDGPTS